MSATKLQFESDSEFISLVEYFPKTKELTVTLQSGQKYTHPAVSFKEFSDFSEASSHGNFYNTKIKNQHPYVPSQAEIKRNSDAFDLLQQFVQLVGTTKAGPGIITNFVKDARAVVNRKI